jgi:hypothetical protein
LFEAEVGVELFCDMAGAWILSKRERNSCVGDLALRLDKALKDIKASRSEPRGSVTLGRLSASKAILNNK